MRFSELQTIINAHRKAQNLPIKTIPEAIKAYEDQVERYQAQYDAAVQAKKTGQDLAEIYKLLDPAKRRLKHEIEKYQGR
jgi:hypothetical protein